MTSKKFSIKNFELVVALSGLLLITSAMATDVEGDSRGVSRAATFCRMLSTVRDCRWWDDWLEYSRKTEGADIIGYVDNLANTDPKGAMWFFVTGAWFGFNQETPTTTQERRLSSAIQKVARYAAYAGEVGSGLEIWSKSMEALEEGKLHLLMLDRVTHDLRKESAQLLTALAEKNAEIARLEALLASSGTTT